MDALSEALNAVRMTGAIFFHAECAAPWGFAVPSVSRVQHVLSPGTERLVNYNLMTEGTAVARFGDGEEVTLRPGDLTILPHGDAHTVSNGSPRALIDNTAGLADILRGNVRMLRFGEDGEITRFICGFFGGGRSADRLFLAGLPRLIRINIRENPASAWLETAIRHLVSEAESTGPAAPSCSRGWRNRSSSRRCRYMEQLPSDQTGWLAGRAIRSLAASWRCCIAILPTIGLWTNWQAPSAPRDRSSRRDSTGSSAIRPWPIWRAGAWS